MQYFTYVYKKEVKICREQFKKKKGCAWGECATCGVIPLLYKFETGKIVDAPAEIEKLKAELLGKD